MSPFLALPLLMMTGMAGQHLPETPQPPQAQAQAQAQSQPPQQAATAGPTAGRPGARIPQTPEDDVAHLLDLGLEVGNPFPVRNAMPPPPYEAHTDRARAVVRLANAARTRGLDRSKDVVRAIAAASDMLLAEKLMQTITDAIVIDPRVVRETYDRFPDRYDEFELAHILLSTETAQPGVDTDAAALARAKAVQARLAAGESFENVAMSASDDKDSASQGGVLPNTLGASIQPIFIDAVKGMTAGQVSAIVKSEYGYHIIKLIRRTHVLTGPAHEMITHEIKVREIRKQLPELLGVEVNPR